LAPPPLPQLVSLHWDSAEWVATFDGDISAYDFADPTIIMTIDSNQSTYLTQDDTHVYYLNPFGVIAGPGLTWDWFPGPLPLAPASGITT
jgi:hypothetical protein